MSCHRAFVDKDTVEKTGCCPCPRRNITARPGDTVLFTCSIPWWSPNRKSWKVTWKKRQEDGSMIIVHSQAESCVDIKQDERYIGRTSLSVDGEKSNAGDLELRNIETSDSGVYTFWVTQLPESEDTSMCCEVELKIGNTDMTTKKGYCCK